MKREDAYESIRELIDEIDTLKHTMFVFSFDRSLMDDDVRGLKSYAALWMRIQNEIDGTRFNRFADIVDLDRLIDEVYTPENIIKMSTRLAHLINRFEAGATPISLNTAEELHARSRFGKVSWLGRILRQSSIKRTAKLYYLYIGSSNEEKDLLAGISRDLTGTIPILDLDYDQTSQTFQHYSYQALADRVIAYTQHKGWSKAIIAEITKNLERGKLGCDWWLSEQDCRLKIKNAPSRSEQNYWISMRLLVQASLGRLAE